MRKLLLFFIFILPLAWLVGQAALHRLGANPVESVIHTTGQWILNCLLATLAITPLRQVTGNPALLRYRRMLGLFAFFYATLHLLSYAGLDQWFDWTSIVHDVRKHPFVLLGLTAYLTLLPLAATSNRWSVARLKQHWKTLHRLAYVAPVLGVLHFVWLVKKDLTQPLLYASLFGLLLAFRLPLGAKYLRLHRKPNY